VSNLYVDEQSLRKLVEYINKQFLVCSNKQSSFLLEGCIDLDNKFITIFCIMIILPIAKSVAFNQYEYMFIEYLLVFLAAFLYLMRQFARGSEMKGKYMEAEEELEEKFIEIQEEFNKRFDYLKMEYSRTYSETDEDYLEIKVIKIPSSMKSLENRLKNKLELTPIEE
jgi:hypothetical protein